MIARFVTRRLAIGRGLAAWALEPAPSPRPSLPPGYWWRRFPLELLFGLLDVISEFVWRVLSEQFRVDDHGAVHVRDRAVAVVVAVAIALLFTAFQMWGVWRYDVGYRSGMAAHWSTH